MRRRRRRNRNHIFWAIVRAKSHRKYGKGHKKKWVNHYKGAPRTKPSDYERKGRSPLDALKAWANSLGHYE